MFYFYECEICGHLHPCRFTGDCRDDENRFTNEDAETEYGVDNITIVPMDEADDHPSWSK